MHLAPGYGVEGRYIHVQRIPDPTDAYMVILEIEVFVKDINDGML